MERHLLLIGFSCTGKTYLGKKAFEGKSIIDSDDELLEWIKSMHGEDFRHIYEIYMVLGRHPALELIAEAETALIDRWAQDDVCRIISLGPSFPLRENWPQLRRVRFRKSPEQIYERFMSRRSEIFSRCPEAKDHDNWDTDVIVDEDKNQFSPEEAVRNIGRLLAEREEYYKDNDTELDTNDETVAVQKLRELHRGLEN